MPLGRRRQSVREYRKGRKGREGGVKDERRITKDDRITTPHVHPLSSTLYSHISNFAVRLLHIPPHIRSLLALIIFRLMLNIFFARWSNSK